MPSSDAHITTLRAKPPPDAARERPESAARALRRPGADAWAVAGLALLFVVFTAATWKTWGFPQADFGVELSAADRIAHGGVLYEDIRYFYGPLGVHCLALVFAVFGTSFTTAFAFGLAVAAAIYATFYGLARTWLTPLFAAIATAIAMAIGFTGSMFGYVAPHTTSATFGLLAILLQLLALTRGRTVLAGVATGAVALTRPELTVVALAIDAGFLAGHWLEAGRRVAFADARRLFAPALLIPLAVLLPFAIAVGPGDLLFNQLIPLDFARVSGLQAQADWAPFTPTSGVALLARGLAYALPVAGLATSAWLWRKRRDAIALVPLAVGLGFLLALDMVAHFLGAFPGTTGVVQTEARRMLLGMSWLPVAVLAAAAWALLRGLRRERAPISGTWSLDLALLAGAFVLATRAYNGFTTDTYAAYYAPLLVLLAVILHQRVAQRWPGSRTGLLVALGAVFAGLAWSAVADGPAAEDDFELRTARGNYLAPVDSGPDYQRTLDLVRERTAPGEPVLALPLEGGLPFATGRPAALPEPQFHPGVLDSPADEREALATLRAEGVRLVVEGNTRFDAWGSPRIGVDYNRYLLEQIARRYPRLSEVGDFADAPPGLIISSGFRLYQGPAGGAR